MILIVLQYAAVILIGYLLGAIPSGYIAGRMRGVDIREYGSGRTGGSNVLRTVGRKAFAFTVVCDLLKGAVAVLLGRALLGTEAAAVLGGIGLLPGAMLGGLLIGLIETFWSAYFTIEYKDVAAFSMLAILLIFFPSGLLGRPEVDKV